MKRWFLVVATMGAAMSALAQGQGQGQGQGQHGPEDLNDHGNNQGPEIISIMWARDVPAGARVGEARARSPLMTYHGGKIMTTAKTEAIFWGPSWSNVTFVGDKITGLDSWYTGFSNSNYAKTSDEYTGSNGQVGAITTHLGHVMDPSTAAGGGNSSVILATVCRNVSSPDASGSGYYAVYSDVKRGNAQYCAWHSAGSCGGKPVQFAFFFNLDGDAGCNPSDSMTGHSQGLAALVNVSAHELSEARSDPSSPGGWYDSSGEENGDKCAWTFNRPYVTLSNGTIWKMQGEWSNAAYTAGTGYANSSGQKGCLDGF